MRTVFAQFWASAYLTPMSHSLDDCKGSSAKDSGIGCSRFGSNFDGGEVFRVNLYLARCAPTAGYDVISTAWLGDDSTGATHQQREDRSRHRSQHD